MRALSEQQYADGLLVLRSELLQSAGFEHAFSTAIGPEGSLFDLSPPSATRGAVETSRRLANLHRFDRLFGDRDSVVTTEQVHGTCVIVASEVPSPADALVGTNSTQVVGVRTADCVPILLADPESGLVAAVHAGWRGLVSDVIAETVQRLERLGSTARGLLAAIGPAIGTNAFEIGPEVAARFEESGLGDSLLLEFERPHADLFKAARGRLLAAGVAPAGVDGDPTCTYEDPRFFSYRRSGQNAGSQLAAIRGGSNREVMRT